MRYILKQGQSISFKTADTLTNDIDLVLSSDSESVKISLNKIIDLYVKNYLRRELKVEEDLLVLYQGNCSHVSGILICTKMGMCVDNYMSIAPSTIRFRSESIELDKEERRSIQEKYQAIKKMIRKREIN